MIFCHFVLCEFNPLHCITPTTYLWERVKVNHFLAVLSSSIFSFLFMVNSIHGPLSVLTNWWEIWIELEYQYILWFLCLFRFLFHWFHNRYSSKLLLSFLFDSLSFIFVLEYVFLLQFFALCLGAWRSIQSIMAYSWELCQIQLLLLECIDIEQIKSQIMADSNIRNIQVNNVT